MGPCVGSASDNAVTMLQLMTECALLWVWKRWRICMRTLSYSSMSIVRVWFLGIQICCVMWWWILTSVLVLCFTRLCVCSVAALLFTLGSASAPVRIRFRVLGAPCCCRPGTRFWQQWRSGFGRGSWAYACIAQWIFNVDHMHTHASASVTRKCFFF